MIYVKLTDNPYGGTEMQNSYRRALTTNDVGYIEFEIHRIRRMMRPCGWKAEKCAPLYARLNQLRASINLG